MGMTEFEIEWADIISLEERLGHLEENIAAWKKAYAENRIKEILESLYDIGLVIDVAELFGGEVNRNYKAVTKLNGEEKQWFIRRYEPGRQIEEVLYEYYLLLHFKNKNFDLTPVPVAAKDGSECVREKFGEDENYFLVTEFLAGDNTYQWERNNVSEKACESAARSLARFHTAAADFDPGENVKVREPVISVQLRGYGASIRKSHEAIRNMGGQEKEGADDIFIRYLDSKEPYLDTILPALQKIFEREDELYKTVAHTDPHPGNFKYLDDEVVGIFDFDWVKKDVRLYDLAIGAMFFCCSWESHKNGEADLPLLELFLSSYTDEITKQGSVVPAITDYEAEVFAKMMAIGSLYVVNFSLKRCANEKGMNLFLSLFYTQHQMRCVEWILEHEEQITEIIRRVKNE